ncbi:MAG: long-chain-fatty-acid--CoA ligase [Campylobacterota bacterium]|nr:long-chain-fatty-acid--CoA ligase [Campylobacterota bacterium]
MELTYPYQNFYEMIEANAASHPKKPLIFIDDQKTTNLQFLQKVDAFARFLEIAGVKKGDRVALITPNCEEFVISVFSITKLGAIAVPVNNLLKEAEYEYILNDCEANLLITSNKFLKGIGNIQEKTGVERTIWVDEAPELNDHNIMFDEVLDTRPHKEEKYDLPGLDDLAIFFYTSGTTGNPKGAMLSYRNIFSNILGVMELFKVTPKDRFIVYLPMFHAFTFSIIVMLPIFAKSSFVIIRSILPFSNIIKQTLLKRVTVFLGVPDIYNALIRADLPWYFLWFNSIRVFISGASALSEDTINRFGKIFKRAKMLEGYGLSECSPAVAVNTLHKQKVLSIGPAMPGYEVKIVDEQMVELPWGEVGELIVKGDCVMQGYLNRPEATAETIINGWLRTGDLGKMDSEGFIYIVDRMKDLIISKGVNIYPREIEEQLMNLEYIKAAAVIGIKDPNSGEVPIAFIELEEGIDPDSITQSRVKSALKENLANFKIPKSVTIIDELPKNATGKVLKRVLKEQIAADS